MLFLHPIFKELPAHRKIVCRREKRAKKDVVLVDIRFESVFVVSDGKNLNKNQKTVSYTVSDAKK